MPDQVGHDGWIRSGMTVGSGRARLNVIAGSDRQSYTATGAEMRG